MLAGFEGQLLSEYFLERALASQLLHPPADVFPEIIAASQRSTVSFGPASSIRALLERGAEPLLRALGFDSLHQVEGTDEYSVALVRAFQTPITLVVGRWGERLEACWRIAVLNARRLESIWCFLYNGVDLRLIETCRLYSRRYISFSIEAVVDEPRTRSAFASVFSAPMLSRDRDGVSPLQTLIADSEQHASAVCRSLRVGVLQASAAVLEAILQHPRRMAPDRRAAADAFEQALTIVYRILFLLFAEARGLLPLWHPIYRDSYSLDAVREAAERPVPALGMWEALRASSRLVHAGCRAGDLRVTGFNGRLFSPARTPLAERCNLDDAPAQQAVLDLSTRPTPGGGGRERIAYRDLGVEQLGAVYEALLDYAPRVVVGEDRPDRKLWRVTLESGSGLRKATGSFYTPQSIARYLVSRTLTPLVHDASPEQILALKIVDPAMGSGAFLVAACGFLAQAYESRLIESGRCHSSDFATAERMSIRRQIAERCLYGVDVNPMAVQLARLSLWLATLAADRPLTFLDHHLQTGDSLLGAWLSALKRAPATLRSRSATTLPLWEKPLLDDALRQALPIRFSLASAPDDTVAQVRDKEQALAALTRRDSALSKWRRVADLWCAHWFSPDPAPPGAFAPLCDAILTGASELPQPLARTYLGQAEAAAGEHRFFHWELEFPEVFFDQDGRPLRTPGFDAVIGNPPWDMIRADAGSEAERSRARTATAATLRFTRDAGVYSSPLAGHGNKYQLFVERAAALAKHEGRIGLILPSSFAADHGSAPLRRMLLSRCDVDTIVGFDNRRGVFPIHRSMRFLLLTATRGRPTESIGIRLGELDPSVLETANEEPLPLRVTPSLLTLVTGDEMALPDFRSSIDLAIAERAATLFPPLGSVEGWAARFGRELNATEDGGVFGPPRHGLPVIEGKQIESFRTRLADSRWSIRPADADRLLGTRHHRPRLAYRDVASATNRQTLIAAILPAHTVSTHTVFCLRTGLPHRAQAFLCGLFNSLVVNYLVRLRVITHVTTAIVERLPIPLMQSAPHTAEKIATLAGHLATKANPARVAQLNALVGVLYQLTRKEFEYVLSTFPLIPKADRDAALRRFSVISS